MYLQRQRLEANVRCLSQRRRRRRRAGGRGRRHEDHGDLRDAQRVRGAEKKHRQAGAGAGRCSFTRLRRPMHRRCICRAAYCRPRGTAVRTPGRLEAWNHTTHMDRCCGHRVRSRVTDRLTSHIALQDAPDLQGHTTTTPRRRTSHTLMWWSQATPLPCFMAGYIWES